MPVLTLQIYNIKYTPRLIVLIISIVSEWLLLYQGEHKLAFNEMMGLHFKYCIMIPLEWRFI
jgi:hypothetical protein